MKIWRVTLSLYSNFNEDGYGTIFKCELNDKEYELNTNSNEYIYWSGWVNYSIPTNIQIRKNYDTYIVEQGFDHEPSASELITIKEAMRKALIDYLNNELEKQYVLHSRKMEALSNIDRESDN